MDDPLLPRPEGTYTVKCPSCRHAINDHDKRYPAPGCATGSNLSGCPCAWTPNDIAWSLLYSGLTKMASPTPITDRIKRSLPW